MTKAKTFILLIFALLTASCTREQMPDTPFSPSDKVATEQDLAPSGYDVLFVLGERTKSGIKIVDGTEISRTGFYVSSKTSMAGSSSAQWSNSHFIDGGSGLFSGGKVWAYSDLGYSFYASNVTMTDTDGHPRVVVNTIDTDIVCAYLPVDQVSFRESNTLTFNHILSRIDKVSLEEVLGDMTGMTVKATVNTQGTYDIASGTWTSVGGQQTITFTPGSDDDRKWIVPGIYMMEMVFTDKLGNERHLKKSLTFNPGVASIIEVKVPHSELDFDDDVRDEAADMYIAQKKTLTVTGSGSGYDPTSLKWKIISGSDVVKLNGNTGESVEFVGLDDGSAVVKVTDGIEDVSINVTVKKPHLVIMFSENMPTRVGLDGTPIPLKWDFRDDNGNKLLNMDPTVREQMLSPDPVFFAYDNKMKDVINVEVNNEDEEIQVNTQNIDVFGSTEYSNMSGKYRVFTCSYDSYNYSYRTGRLDTTNQNLVLNPTDSQEIMVKLPVVKSFIPENLKITNVYWSTGSYITKTNPFIEIANAKESGLEAGCDKIDYQINYESNGIGVSWPKLVGSDYSQFIGVYKVSITCRNFDGSTLILIPYDKVDLDVKMELGIALRLGYDGNKWWIATAPGGSNSASLPSDVYRKDVIRNYIEWNPDITFEESHMTQDPKVKNQLGQAISLEKILEYYNFPRPLEDNMSINMSDFILKPGVDETDFSYPYLANIEYKNKNNKYVWGTIGTDGALPDDISGGNTDSHIIYKFLYNMR